MEQIIELKPKGQQEYIAIRDYVNKKLNRQQAANKLGISVRQVTRLKQSYLRHGKTAFIHKSRGRKSSKRTESFIENKG